MRTKLKVKDVPKHNLILQKKYFEQEKEEYRKKLRYGITPEKYKADKAWRPGGKAIVNTAHPNEILIKLQLNKFGKRPSSANVKGRRSSKNSQAKRRRDKAPAIAVQSDDHYILQPRTPNAGDFAREPQIYTQGYNLSDFERST